MAKEEISNEQEEKIMSSEQALMCLNVMDMIERDIQAIHPRFDKYFLCWQEFQNVLIGLVSEPQPGISNVPVQDIPADIDEEEEIIDTQELPSEELSVDDVAIKKMATEINNAIPPAQMPDEIQKKKFINPTLPPKQVVHPPKMPARNVGGIVPQEDLLGAVGSRVASRSNWTPPKINEDDIFDDGGA